MKFMEALQNVDTRSILASSYVNNAYSNFECKQQSV